MILVTGGTGLVGSHLLWHLLQRGEKVRAIHRPGSDLEQVRQVFGYYESTSPGSPEAGTFLMGSPVQERTQGELFSLIEWFPTDILDPVALSEAFEGISKVYHCAAIISFDPSERKQVIKNNIESTATIVNLCLEHKVKKLCHVSSVSALGTRYDEEPVSERDLWKPSKRRHAYSISKYHSEMEVWRGIEEGLNAVIVNPSVILGPGNWKRGSAAFFTRTMNGMNYYTGGMTGFVDVRDVCRCMIGLMESDISGERFIVNSEDLYFRDFFNMVADALGKPRPSKYASKKLVEAGWRLEWLRSKLTFSKPLLTRETARSGRGISRFSNTKIRETLGYVFFPVRETIAWTARELLNKHELLNK
jgi:dihydroflavonol-4-reductase